MGDLFGPKVPKLGTPANLNEAQAAAQTLLQDRLRQSRLFGRAGTIKNQMQPFGMFPRTVPKMPAAGAGAK